MMLCDFIIAVPFKPLAGQGPHAHQFIVNVKMVLYEPSILTAETLPGIRRAAWDAGAKLGYINR